jgi:hypothetical protein
MRIFVAPILNFVLLFAQLCILFLKWNFFIGQVLGKLLSSAYPQYTRKKFFCKLGKKFWFLMHFLCSN